MNLESKYIADEKVFELIEILKKKLVLRDTQQFCDTIGIKKQGITQIKNGTSHFTLPHIKSICDYYNVNANWVFGLEKKIFRK